MEKITLEIPLHLAKHVANCIEVGVEGCELTQQDGRVITELATDLAARANNRCQEIRQMAKQLFFEQLIGDPTV